MCKMLVILCSASTFSGMKHFSLMVGKNLTRSSSFSGLFKMLLGNLRFTSILRHKARSIQLALVYILTDFSVNNCSMRRSHSLLLVIDIMIEGSLIFYKFRHVSYSRVYCPEITVFVSIGAIFLSIEVFLRGTKSSNLLITVARL